MDIQNLTAAQNYASARPATAPVDTSAGAALQNGMRDFAQTLRQGEEAAMAAMTSQSDPHALVQALSQAELAVETAVTVRNRVVEAYQEILRMPV